MELQKAKQICRLTNKELDSMINSAYKDLIQNKKDNIYECIYVFEEDASKSHFMATNLYDNETIFLSVDKIMYYHPLYMFLYGKYPNIASDIMYDDCLLCLKELIARLVSQGYKIAIRDAFFNQKSTCEILNFIKGKGYSTSVAAFKGGFLTATMDAIYKYAISLITGLKNVSIASITISISELLEYFNSGIIDGLYIKDSMVSFSYKHITNDKPDIKFNVNRALDYLEPMFYEQFEKLNSFIESHKRFLAPEEYDDLKQRLEFLNDSYYKTIDISFLAQDKGR